MPAIAGINRRTSIEAIVILYESTYLVNFMRTILVLLASLIWSNSSSADVIKGQDGNDVVKITSNQEKMALAMERGFKTIDKLFESLQANNPDHSRHGIKIGYREDKTEYLWLYSLGVNEKGLHGTLANKPYYAKNINIGDVINIEPGDVVDWSYVDKGVLVGGYTLRVMFEEYSEAEKVKIQKQLGYKIQSQ